MLIYQRRQFLSPTYLVSSFIRLLLINLSLYIILVKFSLVLCLKFYICCTLHYDLFVCFRIILNLVYTEHDLVVIKCDE